MDGAIVDAERAARRFDGALRAANLLTAGCSVCHTIGGTLAQATVGPSLTHLKGRAWIAAGTLRNTRANLEGWITNPQAIKPGTHMPTVPLQPGQLTALVAYLETLK